MPDLTPREQHLRALLDANLDTTLVSLTLIEQEWFARAIEQLDAYEVSIRAQLAIHEAPPEGDQAAKRRELRRRARIEHLSRYLRDCLSQIALARDALAAQPTAGKLAYHAMGVALFARYPDTADVNQASRAHREAAVETNRGLKFQKLTPTQKKPAGR